MGRQSLAKKGAVKASNKLSATSITAERTNAIAQMNAPLQRKLTQVDRSLNDLRAENLKYYHRIGAICEDIRNNPETYVGKDGTPGLKLIEQALSTQARTLRKAAMFARMYDETQLTSLIGLVNTSSGFQLHWGHVSFLLTVPTAEKREKFAQEAVSKMLPPPALHELIKKRTQKTGGHGRGHEMPKTIPAQIRQVLTVCRQWTGKNTKVWNGIEESVFGNLLNMPPDNMEPDMLDQLTEIETLMQEISTAASENVGKTQRAREHMAASIKKRDELAAAEAASGRQTRAIDLEGDGTGAGTGRRRRQATTSSVSP